MACAQGTNLLVAEVVQTHSAGLCTRLWGTLGRPAQPTAPSLKGRQSLHHATLEQVHLWGEGRHSLAGLKVGGIRTSSGWLLPGFRAPAGSVSTPAAGPGPQGLCTEAWPPAGWRSKAAAGASREGSRVSGALELPHPLPPVNPS